MDDLQSLRLEARAFVKLIPILKEMGFDVCATNALLMLGKRLEGKKDHPRYSEARELLDEVLILKGYKKRDA